jgi:hypothetical protein
MAKVMPSCRVRLFSRKKIPFLAFLRGIGRFTAFSAAIPNSFEGYSPFVFLDKSESM